MALNQSPKAYLEQTARGLILALTVNSAGCVEAPEDQPQITQEDISGDNQTCIESNDIPDYVNAHLEFSFPKNHDGVAVDNEGQHLFDTDGITPVALDGIYPLEVSTINGDDITFVPKGLLPFNHTAYTAHIVMTDTLAEDVLEDSPNLDCITPTEEDKELVIWEDTETEDGLHFRLGMDDDFRCEKACNELNGGDGDGDGDGDEETTPDMGTEGDGDGDTTGDGDGDPTKVCTKLVYNGPDHIAGNEWDGIDPEPKKAVEYGQLLACYDDEAVCTTPFDLTKAQLTILPHGYNTVDLDNNQQPDEPVTPGQITPDEMQVNTHQNVVLGMLEVNPLPDPELEIDVAITSDECGPTDPEDSDVPSVHLTVVPYKVEGDPDQQPPSITGVLEG